MTRPLTAEDKLAAWNAAFLQVSEQITPAPMRAVIDKIIEGAGQIQDGEIQAYAALVSSSMQMARVVAANDRAAAITAAMLVQSGVSRPIVEVDDAD